MSGLVGQILSIPSGGKAIVTLSAAGKSGVFVVYYDEQRAIGDSGHSVPGMVSGEYEVWMAKNSDNPTPDHNILRQHVSPGKPGGQQMAWAAEQCARAITNAVLRYGSVERKAMNRMTVARELVRVAKELVAVPMSFDAPTMETTRWAERTLRVALNADTSWRKIYELFMTV